MNIKDLNLKIGDRIRQKNWNDEKFVTVSFIESIGGQLTYYAEDENGHECTYGPYGDWEIVE